MKEDGERVSSWGTLSKFNKCYNNQCIGRIIDRSG